MYADDTLFSEDESDVKCYNNLKEYMKNINTWFSMNKLKLNEGKTKLMEINKKSDYVFRTNNKEIENVNYIKYI